MKTHKATEQCYFIAHDPSVHYGKLESGQEIATGQANLEIFDNEEEYVNRLNELGVTLEEEEDKDEDENLEILMLQEYVKEEIEQQWADISKENIELINIPYEPRPFQAVLQNASFVFNPFAILGSNKNYRIYAIRRQDGAAFDGVHCMIRKVENGVESGIPGLLDWGAGVNDYASVTSDVLNSGTSDSFMWFRCYFAAYNGANLATLQDLTLWIIAE